MLGEQIILSTCSFQAITFVTTLLGKEHNDIFASHHWSWCEKQVFCKICVYATMGRLSPVVFSIPFFFHICSIYWERTTIIIVTFLWCFRLGSHQVATDWLAEWLLTDWLLIEDRQTDWLICRWKIISWTNTYQVWLYPSASIINYKQQVHCSSH